MGESIFVLDSNNKIIELKESKYSSEDIFQELIEKYPNILAGDQITPDNPRRWIFISREIGVPDKEDGSNRWYLDHLFIDQDAIPTFVEVKRSTDTRVRREVVAQMLDYAANATEYWSVDDIRKIYEEQNKSLCDDLEIEEGSEELFWQSVKNNFKLGKIRLLFVSDEIPLSLKRIIEFLNGQMIDTEVLGLEIKQFISNAGLKTFVPRIIGQTSNSVQVKIAPGYFKWDEESFLKEVEKVDIELVKVCKEIVDQFTDLGCYIYWGEGKQTGSFVPIYEGKQRHQLFAVFSYTKQVKLELYFQHYKEPYFTYEKKKEMQKRLSEILEFKIKDSKLNKRPSFNIDILKDDDKRKVFIDYFGEIIKDIKKSE